MDRSLYVNFFEDEPHVLYAANLLISDDQFLERLLDGLGTETETRSFLMSQQKNKEQPWVTNLVNVALNRALFHDRLDLVSLLVSETWNDHYIFARITHFKHPPKKCLAYFLEKSEWKDLYQGPHGSENPLELCLDLFHPNKTDLAKMVAEAYETRGQADYLITCFSYHVGCGPDNKPEQAFDVMMAHLWEKLGDITRKDVWQNIRLLCDSGLPLTTTADVVWRAGKSKEDIQHLLKDHMHAENSINPKKARL